MNSYKNLFLSQSYTDSYEEYKKSLKKDDYPVWDYVIITASNEMQARAYEEQIDYRLENSFITKRTKYKVIPDPDGKRVGSGGASLNVLRYIAEDCGRKDFADLKILCIHSGGDSKRVPQYSACGKLFSPVPRELSDGRRTTLFDEFIIAMTGVPARMRSGMLTASGDVLLLFNPLQLDFHTVGSAVLSIKEKVSTGKNHGVFLADENGYVNKFLHKQSEESLEAAGAVDARRNVDIDTGACIFSSEILADLYSLIDTEEKFQKFVNEKARLSFYGDFQYPLASDSTLEQFYNEAPEGEFTEELKECRTKLWEILRKYPMKILRFSPAAFIHFGTTGELLSLMTEHIKDFSFLGWSDKINTNTQDPHFASSNSYIHKKATIGKGSYIEDSIIKSDTVVGENCVISCVTLNGQTVPDNTVLHGLKLSDGRFVVRMYATDDNPKEPRHMGSDLPGDLWSEKLFKPCDTMDAAVNATLNKESASELISLKESFNMADVTAILPWQRTLDEELKTERLLDDIRNRRPSSGIKRIFNGGISQSIKDRLVKYADTAEFGEKIRIYYYLSSVCDGDESEKMTKLCFASIRNALLAESLSRLTKRENMTIKKDEVLTRLPVRVNFGGGWSDTPPYCNEHGGTVLNAAITLNGRYPVEVKLRRLDEYKVILESADNNSYGEFTELSELNNLGDPHDPFALHKAVLVACDVIPAETDGKSLENILKSLGGGIYLSTRVINIPRGSGLGTSSILSAACVKGIYEFMNVEVSPNEIYTRVLCLEQLMSTGGGWQDQVGGLTSGIKMNSARPGLYQDIHSEPLNISAEIIEELNRRFCIVYTGQRRLARNLLREVMGKYIGSDSDVLHVLYEIQRIAVLMKFELEKGNIDGFAGLLNSHWELSKKLDKGCTNTCIDQIFNTIEDLIDGKMICGAGGGGFLQVVLKKDVTVDMLRERVNQVFADTGIDVWTCEFI